MEYDLDAMSRSELETLARDVEKALKQIAGKERKEALKAAREAAKVHGFDLDELFAGETATKAKSSKPKNPAKYRNPDNPDQTWSGRGRKPQWIVAHEAAGLDIADFAI